MARTRESDGHRPEADGEMRRPGIGEGSSRRGLPSRETGSSPATGTTLSPRRRWLGFTALMLGLFTLLSASTSVNTALTVLQQDLHGSLSQVEWLVDSYFIVFVVFLTPFGRLGDIFGRKWMFLAGGVVFVAGSIGSALVRDIDVLIAFRALTGFGPAAMMPATLSLITILFPPEKRGLPMGLWGSLVGVAIGVGPVMGGLIVSNTSWEWVFWVNVILGAFAVALGFFLLPSRRRSGERPALDPPGIALNAGFILCLSYALVEGHNRGWTSPLILGLFAASVVLFLLFLARELTTRQPMLDLNLFREPAFSAGIVVTITLSFGLLGIFVYMPLFLQQGPLHDSAVQSGLTILPLSLAMIVSGPFGGYLAGRVSPHRPIAVAMLLFSGGMFWLAHLTVSTGWQWLVPPFAVIGVGLGMASANINTAVMATVPRPVVGAAAGVVTTVRQLGSVLGIAVLGVVLQERESVHLAHYLRGGKSAAAAQALAFTDAMNDTFLVCAAVLFAGALAALAVRYRRGGGSARAGSRAGKGSGARRPAGRREGVAERSIDRRDPTRGWFHQGARAEGERQVVATAPPSPPDVGRGPGGSGAHRAAGASTASTRRGTAWRAPREAPLHVAVYHSPQHKRLD